MIADMGDAVKFARQPPEGRHVRTRVLDSLSTFQHLLSADRIRAAHPGAQRTYGAQRKLRCAASVVARNDGQFALENPVHAAMLTSNVERSA